MASQSNKTDNSTGAATMQEMYEGKQTQTIDVTPTWEGMLSYYLIVLEDGNKEGKAIAKKELANMAKAADLFNELMKDHKAILNEVDTAFATLFIGSDHGITPQAMEACKTAAINVQIALGFRNEDGSLKG